MLDNQKPRLAKSTDLEGILALAERKTYAEWPSQGCESRKVAALDFLRGTDGSEYDLLVTGGAQGVTGFLVLKKQVTRSITGDRESIIQDWFALEVGERGSLLECAAEAARGYASQFLTVEVATEETQEREVLQAAGFQLESHKISVATADCCAPEGSPYSIRAAAPGDDFLIAVLNSTMLEHTLCAGRDYDLSELTFRSMDAIFHQVNRQDPGSATLVLTKGQELVGYLLLEIMETTGYVYDLAIERAHWGGKAVLHVMRAGSQLLFQRNLPLLVGDISASNLRALKIAQRLLGFRVDCLRYGLRL